MKNKYLSILCALSLIIFTFLSCINYWSFNKSFYKDEYKIKSKVIDIIEKNGTYDDTTVRTEIEDYLKTAAYSSESNKTGEECPTEDGNSAINTLKNYRFCIYQHKTVKGSYYTVRVYMTYNIPVIGDFIKLRYHITGDTRVIFSF